VHCESFKTRWYRKIRAADPEFVDIEYGLEHPERLYDPPANSTFDSSATEYSDRVLELSRFWEQQGRSRRDTVLAELYGEGKTVREISSALRSRRLKPRSIGAVHKTIQEIDAIVLKNEHRHLGEEQSRTRARVPALSLLDSKPKKDEADGQTTIPQGARNRAA
jgi:hypothetical protein